MTRPLYGVASIKTVSGRVGVGATMLMRQAALLTVVFVVSCSSTKTARFSDVRASVNGLELTLSVGTCGADLTSEVTETATDVRINVTAENDHENAACADLHVVRLSAPLGQRVLMDDKTDQPVPVQLADRP